MSKATIAFSVGVLLLVPLAAHTTPATAASSSVTVIPKPDPGDKFAFADVMAMVAAGKSSAEAVGKIKAATKVRFVEIHTVKGYTSTADALTPDQQKSLVALGTIIARNTALMSKLRHAGFLLSDVLAVTFDTDTSAVVFINL